SSQSKRSPGRPNRKTARRPAAAETFLVCIHARDEALPFTGAVAAPARKALEAGWRELGRSHAGLLPDAFSIGTRCVQGILSIASGADGLSLADAVRLFKVVAARRLS